MKKILLLFCLFMAFSFSSFGQNYFYKNASSPEGYTYRKDWPATTWVYLGALPKSGAEQNQKLIVKLFGGHESISSLGTTTYSAAVRFGLKVSVDRQGGGHDESIYKFKIYETANAYEFAIEVPYRWVIFHIESMLVGNMPAKFVEIKNYDPTGKTDVTEQFTFMMTTVSETNGNIGIGKLPTAKLDVDGDIKGKKLDIDGTIHAREVKIDNNGWADFVFEESYDLKTLSEVEQFIKTNKHLPDIPSQQEVEEKGIDVGEMQAKLLQKIEELTLYVIELKKENEEQAKQIKELQNK